MCFFLAVFCAFGFKVAESANKTPKNFFLKKSKKISKYAEFHGVFESVEKVVKNAPKKVTCKTSLTNMSKVKKVHISVTFLLISFFVCIFSKLFQRIQNQHEILQF